MNFTHPAHQEMLAALVSYDVEFLLIGGYAVNYHGYIRTTGDMDVWLRPNNENKKKLLDVFSKLNFDPVGLEMIEALNFTEVVAFHVGYEPERIDFLTKIQGVDFEAAFQRKKIMHLKDFEVPVLHLNDLIANKILSSRSKDMADVEFLQKVKKMDEN